MSKLRGLATVIGTTALIAGPLTLATSGQAAARSTQSEVVLADSGVPFTGETTVTGAVAGSRELTIQFWLASDVEGAERYATQVSTPGSSLFHRYLSPDAYTARFGASSAEAHALESWLRAEGFSGVHTDSQRSYVRATAAVSHIDSALHIQLDTYEASASVNAGPYELRANDRPVSLPASLAGSVIGVTGLDNASPIVPLIRATTGPVSSAPANTSQLHKGSAPGTPCSRYYGQKMVRGLPQAYGTTSFPTIICGYTAGQMRSAYDANWINTGKGQTIALVEEGLTKDMFLTLQDYAKVNHMPAPSADDYEQLSLGKDSCGDPFDLEEQLDVEVSHDMAPGANQLVVGGDSCNQGDYGNQALYDADVEVIDGDGHHPLATVASNSWESGTEQQPASQTKIEHSYLVRAASEGVGMYFSAGDGSGTLEPSIDPYAIAVGGTTLGIGEGGTRLFETGWSTGASVIKNGAWVLKGEDGASGGGPSIKWAQPGYQVGIVPEKLGTTRVAPDISASADPFTGMALGLLEFHGHGTPPTYYQIPIGGTSESSPLVAGVVTAAQQGQASAFGFINPAIYRLAGTDAFFPTLPLTGKSPSLDRGIVCDIAIFANLCGKPPRMTLTTFDDQNPKMKGYTGQVTLPGYDDMTGLGTPDGQNFIDAMRKLDE